MQISDEMIEAGLQRYSEGGCSGLADYERREVVQDILEAAFALVTPTDAGKAEGDNFPLIQALSRMTDNRHSDRTSSVVSQEDRKIIIDGCYELMLASRHPPLPTPEASPAPVEREMGMGMDEDERTAVPEGHDVAQWRKADEVHHAMALVANDLECVKIIYAALDTPSPAVSPALDEVRRVVIEECIAKTIDYAADAEPGSDYALACNDLVEAFRALAGGAE